MQKAWQQRLDAASPIPSLWQRVTGTFDPSKKVVRAIDAHLQTPEVREKLVDSLAQSAGFANGEELRATVAKLKGSGNMLDTLGGLFDPVFGAMGVPVETLRQWSPLMKVLTILGGLGAVGGGLGGNTGITGIGALLAALGLFAGNGPFSDLLGGGQPRAAAQTGVTTPTANLNQRVQPIPGSSTPIGQPGGGQPQAAAQTGVTTPTADLNRPVRPIHGSSAPIGQLGGVQPQAAAQTGVTTPTANSNQRARPTTGSLAPIK
jgi:hypothetical protein